MAVFGSIKCQRWEYTILSAINPFLHVFISYFCRFRYVFYYLKSAQKCDDAHKKHSSVKLFSLPMGLIVTKQKGSYSRKEDIYEEKSFDCDVSVNNECICCNGLLR